MKKILLTIFGFLATLNFAQAQCNELFISEYVEGELNNKAIEIYNPTNNSISLANYRLIRYDNGNNYAEPIPLEAVLNLPTNIVMAPQTVYVIALNLTDPNGTGQSAPIDLELQSVADTLMCPGCATGTGLPRVMCFNGDDALALQKNSGGTWSNVDIFGCIGERPSNSGGLFAPTAGWTILPPFSSMPVGFTPAGAYFLQYWSQDKTLFRKYGVQNGVTVNPPVASFNASVQWDSLPKNTFYNLGFHDCACDCSDLNSATITFGGNLAVCPGNQTAISANLNGSPLNLNYTFAWSNGQTGQTANLTIGTYTVTITREGTCNILGTVTITPSSAQFAPIASFNSNSPSACLAQDGSISLGLSGGNPPFQYSWALNSSTNDTLFNIGAGSYQCQITDSINCTFSFFGDVQDPGAPTITVDNNSLATCDTCLNGAIAITTNASANATYTWSYNGSVFSSIQDITNLNPGTYTLTILDNGCSASISIAVGNSVGIKEYSNPLKVLLHPNPSNSFISIAANETINSVRIFSVTGSKEKEIFAVVNNQKLNIDISELSVGLHFAIIVDAKGQTKSIKFIKQ